MINMACYINKSLSDVQNNPNAKPYMEDGATDNNDDDYFIIFHLTDQLTLTRIKMSSDKA